MKWTSHNVPQPAPQPASPLPPPLSANHPPPKPVSLAEQLASSQIDFHDLAENLVLKAVIAYDEAAWIEQYLQQAGAADVKVFCVGSTMAYGYTLHGHAWLAFRGTRPKGFRDCVADWRGNIKLWPDGSPPQHSGFLAGWRLVEPQIVSWVNERPADCRRLILTGHSMGGALAVIAALHLSLKFPVRAVITFGAPCAGMFEFHRTYRERSSDPAKAEPTLHEVTRRYTHATDIIPRIPPPILFYWHVGEEFTVSQDGSIEPGPPKNLIARFRIWWNGLFQAERKPSKAARTQPEFPVPPDVAWTRFMEKHLVPRMWILMAPAWEIAKLIIGAVMAGAAVKATDARHHGCQKYVNAFASRARARKCAITEANFLHSLGPFTIVSRDGRIW